MPMKTSGGILATATELGKSTRMMPQHTRPGTGTIGKMSIHTDRETRWQILVEAGSLEAAAGLGYDCSKMQRFRLLSYFLLVLHRSWCIKYIHHVH
mmetsp:Transcript_104618/g.181769  ORF Transcript_104618/g.181769 Transcript_104618/m.181769 type:complete len:96 (+) Transcript_104618:1095-1382(+)